MAQKKKSKKKELKVLMEDSTASTPFEQVLEQNEVLDEYRVYLKEFTDKGIQRCGAAGLASARIRAAHPKLNLRKKSRTMRVLTSKLPSWCSSNKDDFKDRPPISTRKAVDWAVEHVSFRDLEPKDAPSATAWLYILRFREEPTFLNDVLKRRVPNVSKIEQDKGLGDDNRECFEIINRILEENQGEDSILPLSQKG